MFDKIDGRGSRKGISRGDVVLWSVISASGVLTFMLPDYRDQNLVQVGMSGVLVGIIVREHNRSEDRLDAALRIAEEVAKQRTGDERRGDNELAEVIPLPRGRRRKTS